MIRRFPECCLSAVVALLAAVAALPLDLKLWGTLAFALSVGALYFTLLALGGRRA